MHIVIMGCGRVGTALAQHLEERGHSVAIIDQNEGAFRRLGADFKGTTIVGVGFDRDTLTQAGIERADAFAAVSSGDNSNILAARTAREIFGVERVVARIYDPGRAEIYQRFGIPTVATVTWTMDSIARQLLQDTVRSIWRDPTGTMQLHQINPSARLFGRQLLSLEEEAKVRVTHLTRLDHGVIPDEHTVLQEGDLLYVMVASQNVEHAKDFFESTSKEDL